MNAYWDAVKPYVVDGVIGRAYGPEEHDEWSEFESLRDYLISVYSHTITDPATVEFVGDWIGSTGIDPMAGNGWWTDVLLKEQNCCLFPADITPAVETAWTPVRRCDAAEFAAGAENATLLLSWTPRHHDVGERTIRAYRGPRIVRMGADGHASDGTDEMRALLADEWVQVAQHTPVRWYGVQDYVTVYERK